MYYATLLQTIAIISLVRYCENYERSSKSIIVDVQWCLPFLSFPSFSSGHHKDTHLFIQTARLSHAQMQPVFYICKMGDGLR